MSHLYKKKPTDDTSSQLFLNRNPRLGYGYMNSFLNKAKKVTSGIRRIKKVGTRLVNAKNKISKVIKSKQGKQLRSMLQQGSKGLSTFSNMRDKEVKQIENKLHSVSKLPHTTVNKNLMKKAAISLLNNPSVQTQKRVIKDITNKVVKTGLQKIRQHKPKKSKKRRIKRVTPGTAHI